MQRDQIGCVSLSAGYFERPAACSRIYSRIKVFEAVALQDAYSIAIRGVTQQKLISGEATAPYT
jgi:hypothetical protein